jgi:hypothetical protein
LVFTPLTTPYLAEYGEDWYNTAPRKLFMQAAHGRKTLPDEQVVILSHVLSHEVNMGYSHHCNLQLLRFNGEKILNLKHLVKLVAQCTDDYLRFDFDCDMYVDEMSERMCSVHNVLSQQLTSDVLSESRVIILDRNEAKRHTETVLQSYRVPSVVSEDLISEWLGGSTQ